MFSRLLRLLARELVAAFGMARSTTGQDEDGSFDDVLRQLAKTPLTLTDAAADLLVGSRVAEHFVVERVLGRGGMGIVFLATDARLQRSVALKVHTAADPDAVVRLEQEGQALARLSHPNVLAIHEVGTVGDRVFIATEYVDGGTARQYLEGVQAWRQIVELYLQAALGLAAAHDEGFVHRDFKPDNVLVGRDGRVRVADFGLARRAPSQDVRGDASGSSCHRAVDTINSRGDAVAGTPAYMAPEQRAGDEVTPAADQYSLFVALYEGLYGALPFADATAEQADSSAPLLFPSQPRVPRQLKRIVARGLCVDPGKRYPTMAAAIAALRTTIRRGRPAVWVTLAVATTAGAFAVGNQPDVSCDDAADVAASVWSPSVGDKLRGAFAAANPTLGEAAWDRIEPRVQVWVDRWVADRNASCRATHEVGTQSVRMLDRSMLCFDERKAELSGVLGALAKVEPAGVAQAWSTIPTAASLSDCTDSVRLDAQPEVERGSQRQQLRLAMREDLLSAATLAGVGAIEAARERAGSAVERADKLRDPVAICSANLGRARAELAAERIDDALSYVETAYLVADRGRVDACRSEAAALLAHIYADDLRQVGAGKVWLKLALYPVDTLPPETQRIVRVAQGVVMQTDGRYAEAVEVLRSLLESTPPDALRERLTVLGGLATAYDWNDQLELARETYEEALALAVSRIGEDTPSVAVLSSNFGIVLSTLGETAAALEAFERSVAIHDRVRGPDSLGAALVGINQLGGLRDANRCGEAIERAAQVLDAITRHQGARHPDLALVLEARGLCYRRQGMLEASLADLVRATEIQREATGPRHPQVAVYALHTAATLARLERTEDAVLQYSAALEIWDALDQGETPRSRLAAAGRARAQLALGNLEAARADADRTLSSRADDVPLGYADQAAMLVQAQLGAADHKRSAALARKARDSALASGNRDLAAEISAWMSSPTTAVNQ